MFAFWALVLLVAYGCFHGGGLSEQLKRWLDTSNATYIESFPLLGTLDLAAVIALGVLTVIAVVIHRLLNRPKIADTLIDTEGELQKVTWPSWGEAVQGTLAVTVMVLILFAFLTVVDISLAQVMLMLMGGA
jgi:preprotein translocase SecE subunit